MIGDYTFALLPLAVAQSEGLITSGTWIQLCAEVSNWSTLSDADEDWQPKDKTDSGWTDIPPVVSPSVPCARKS